MAIFTTMGNEVELVRRIKTAEELAEYRQVDRHARRRLKQGLYFVVRYVEPCSFADDYAAVCVDTLWSDLKVGQEIKNEIIRIDRDSSSAMGK